MQNFLFLSKVYEGKYKVIEKKNHVPYHAYQPLLDTLCTVVFFVLDVDEDRCPGQILHVHDG